MQTEEMKSHLNIMLDGLKRKANALSEILHISENQRTVIESELPLDGVREMILGMNEEKQASIQIVKACDDMFEKMLKDIGAELEAQQENYKPQVQVLQEHIRKVMSLDVKIRVAEDENNQLLDKRRAEELPQTGQTGIKPKVSMPTDAVKVLNAYKQGKDGFKG
ncbi:MAG: hypothetical protein FWB96_10900 [Defluviitaleaceae bacterium]|nr:hypothetical protein [Defluviitaleaceae bacterium]MCL2263459.1 hypothetical protein [Defluviitaleaceae bacterium]